MPVALLSLLIAPLTARIEAPLANARIYIVRHAEKPEEGAGLTPAGEARAKAYADYFRKDPADGSTLTFSHLFAATDSKKSVRPRLTLEPLAKAIHQKIDLRFTDKDPAPFAEELKSKSHGDRILIAWRHSEIPALLTALDADPAQFVPEGKWPGEVYDRVIELRFDAEGKLDKANSQMVHEHLMPNDAK